MGQELTTFADRPALSPKFAKFFEEKKNIADKDTVPSLSPSGKQWTISIDGVKTVVQRKDSDGELQPVSALKVIILDASPTRGRAYYEKVFDPANPTQPDCWSDDTITPSKHVKKPCAASCAACPMSVKGSKATERNADGVACQQYQMLAVIPAADLGFEPLRLKLAITSIWDGKNKANDEAGKFAFKNYTDYLRAGGVPHTAMLVTKMTFDPAETFPKVLFSRGDFLSDEQVEQIIPVVESEKVKRLIGPSWTPNGVDGTRTAAISGPEDDHAAETAKDVTPKGPTAEEIAAKAQAEVDAKVAAERAAKAEAKKKAIADAQAALAAASADDDDGEVVLNGPAAAPTKAAADAKAGAHKAKATPAAAAATVKPATATAAEGAPAGLSKLLGAWGDD